MNYIDLFSGAGGLSLGFKNAGFNLIFSNEIDLHSVNTQRRNLEFIGDDPNKVISCSIEELHSNLINKQVLLNNSENIHKSKSSAESYINANSFQSDQFDLINDSSQIDLIIGGPPCQGFSSASKGTRSYLTKDYVNYIDDPRNQLFKYFLDFVEHYDPKIVLIENVKGLTSSSNYKYVIEKSLQNTGKGYLTYSQLFDLSKFGIPQIRERLFFIGVREDIPQGDQLIFYLDSLILGQSKNPISLYEAISDLPTICSNPKKLNTEEKNEITIGGKGSFGENVSKSSYEKIIPKPSDYTIEINTFKGNLIKPENLYNHKCRYNNKEDLEIYSKLKPGKVLTHDDNKEALKLVKYSTEKFADKYYKLDPDKPSRTIVAHLKNDNNGYVHYGKIPRGISVREAARIQSFPDWYKFEGPITQQFKQIGNAVPPKFSFVFAEIFKNFLKNGVEGLFKN